MPQILSPDDFPAVVDPSLDRPAQRFAHLDYCLDRIAPDGLVIELGVGPGKTMRHIAGRVAPRPVHGFDDFFNGLPAPWIRTREERASGRLKHHKGYFRQTALPEMPENVTLIDGLFQRTLPGWLADEGLTGHDAGRRPLAFLHVDCDLCDSASYGLAVLDHLIVPGTIIAFDELLDFDGRYELYEEGEWRALHDWLRRYRRRVAPLSRTWTNRGAVRVVA